MSLQSRLPTWKRLLFMHKPVIFLFFSSSFNLVKCSIFHVNFPWNVSPIDMLTGIMKQKFEPCYYIQKAQADPTEMSTKTATPHCSCQWEQCCMQTTIASAGLSSGRILLQERRQIHASFRNTLASDLALVSLQFWQTHYKDDY